MELQLNKQGKQQIEVDEPQSVLFIIIKLKFYYYQI